LNLFHSIIAVLLALVLASPLCCCASGVREAAETPCCASSQQPDDRPSHDCVCESAEPRDAAKILDLPANSGIPLIPANDSLTLLEPAGLIVPAKQLAPRTGCDPPRLALVRLSRWLI